MRAVAAAGIASCLTCAAPAAAGPTTERLEQVIWLKPRGEVEVEERHTIRFETAGANTVVRDVPTPYPLIAVIVSAAIDDRVVPFDDEAGNERSDMQVRARRGLKQVLWNVSVNEGAVHTFAVTYLLWNAVRQDSRGDYFLWRVTPLSPPGRIENADVRLAFSHPLASPPEIGGRRAEAVLEADERRLTLTARGIPEREQLQLTLRFEADSAVGSGLRWQALRAARKRRALLVFPAVVAALATAWIFGNRRKERGEKRKKNRRREKD